MPVGRRLGGRWRPVGWLPGMQGEERRTGRALGDEVAVSAGGDGGWPQRERGKSHPWAPSSFIIFTSLLPSLGFLLCLLSA
ncbi:unnamed protein product [Arctogadus glacialis]